MVMVKETSSGLLVGLRQQAAAVQGCRSPREDCDGRRGCCDTEECLRSKSSNVFLQFALRTNSFGWLCNDRSIGFS